MSKRQTVLLKDLGLQPSYQQVWNYQEELLSQNTGIKSQFFNQPVMERPTMHHLLFTEHKPVYTLGKSAHLENVLISEADMAAQDIEYFKINRGGDVTFHGPGQLVGYPILDLEKFYTDIGKYLRNLEEVIIQTIAHYGIKGGRSAGETGVWIDADMPGRERKICAMGVRCSRWVTMHGWALNVNTDLGYFGQIIPCGIQNKAVTSIKQEIGRDADMEEVKKVLATAFERVFDVDIVEEEVTRYQIPDIRYQVQDIR